MRVGTGCAAMLLVGVSAFAQPVLRLKSGHVPANLLNAAPGQSKTAAWPARASGGSFHLILQFAEHPGAAVRAAVEKTGMRVLSYVPDNGLLVSMQGMVSLEGLQLAGIYFLSAADKLSRDLSEAAGDGKSHGAVVEMHPDIGREEASLLLGELQLEIVENPDLLAHQWLARGTLEQFTALAGRDEVAYIYPASGELMARTPVAACLGGGVDGLPAAASLVTTFGEGWDGPGQGGAILGFYIGSVTQAVPAGAVHAEAARAMAEWAGAARLRFNAAPSPAQSRTLDIQFAQGEHGDGIPFDGPGKTLAHTFYPPPNPEPQAGDIHLDLEEPWKIDADIDVFSVLLHEMGHALGLGHSDDPRSVMYPFYRRYAGLHPVDVIGIQQIYAAPEPGFGDVPPPGPSTPPTPPGTPSTPSEPPSTPVTPPANPAPGADRTPPSLTIYTPTTPSLTTSAETIRISGVATDGGGPVSVTWANSAGGTGAASGSPNFSANLPLIPGLNRITVTAADAAGNTAWRVISVTRR